MSKVALVTGGSRGIGAQVAKTLGKKGYKVAVHYRSKEEQAIEVCKEIENALPIKADLSEPGACEEVMKLVKSELLR